MKKFNRICKRLIKKAEIEFYENSEDSYKEELKRKYGVDDINKRGYSRYRNCNFFDIFREAIDAGFKECQLDILDNPAFSWQKLEALLDFMRTTRYPLSVIQRITDMDYHGEEFDFYADVVISEGRSSEGCIEFLKYLIKNNIRNEDEIYETGYTFFKK